MQRRAAAIYFVLFVLVGAGAFGFIQVGMSKPTVELDGPTYTQGDTLQVDGRTYTLSKVAAKKPGGGGGHGGGGGDVTYSGELQWTNDSFRATATLENGSNTTYKGEKYRVEAPNETDPTSFTLVQTQNVSAILAEDPAVEDQLAMQNGTKYVVYVENQSLREVSTYLPTPNQVVISEGDTIEYGTDDENVTARVDSVAPSGVTLGWDSSKTNTISLSQGTNVTLNGQEYFVHFLSGSEVQILPVDEYYDAYQLELQKVDRFSKRLNGVWGVVILSVIAAIVLLSAAYMPVRG